MAEIVNFVADVSQSEGEFAVRIYEDLTNPATRISLQAVLK